MNQAETLPGETKRRIAVVGGGLSGMAAAQRLIELAEERGRPIDVTVFESSDRIGGVISTQRLGEYLVELGADSFITNKPWAVDLCKRLGLEDRLISTDERFRRSLVLRKGKPVAVPDGFMLMSPTKIGPILRSPIFSWPGKLRMGLEYFLPRRQSLGDESLAEFVQRRFGKEALERLVQPLVGGIYTSDPKRLSLRATMPRFLEMEQEYGSLIRASRRQSARQAAVENHASGARYGLFATLAGGIGELFEALHARIQKSATIVLNRSVTGCTGNAANGGGYRLDFTDGRPEQFDAVILATQAHRAADIIAGEDTELATSLRQIEYASSAIVVTGHRLSDFQHPLDAFGLVVPSIEKRSILAVSFASRKFAGRAPAGNVLLRTFIGGALQPEMLEKDDGELIELVNSELHAMLGMHKPFHVAMVARYDRAMPQYHVGHLQRLVEIQRQIDRHPTLALAGNAFEGVGIPDCIRSGEAAAERVLGGISV